MIICIVLINCAGFLAKAVSFQIIWCGLLGKDDVLSGVSGAVHTGLVLY